MSSISLNILKHILTKTKIRRNINWQGYSTGCDTCIPNDDDACKMRQMFMDPDCKISMITGGSGGLGFAIANELLRQNGKKVALIGTNICKGREAVEKLNCSFGSKKAMFVKCDVRDKREVECTFSQVQHEFGGIDILVNAAGVWDDKNWENEICVNLIGTINTNFLAPHYMSKPGFILNISGVMGIDPLPPSPTISAVYGGIIGFSKSFGGDLNLKHNDLRVCTVCPGITQTDMIINAEQRVYEKYMQKGLEDFLKKCYKQKPEVCACSALVLLKYAPSGTVWVIEGSKLFSLRDTSWKCKGILEAQFF